MMPAQNRAQDVAFTYCINFGSAETKRAAWPKFAATVSRSEPFDTKEQSIRRAAIVGGVRRDEKTGRADNVTSRTILTLDYDDFPSGTNLDEIELALEMGLVCTFVAYSTFRHTPEAPRIRVMAPLSREVSVVEYPLIVDAVAALIGLNGIDPCSKVVNQLMFMASHRTGVDPWSITGGEGALDVDALGIDFGGVSTSEPDIFDLDMAFASQPLDISDSDVDSLLENYPAADCDYDGWLKVGMAIAHQYAGASAGFDRWMAWSALSSKHDPKTMRTKWRSFDGNANPVTMASVIKAAGGLRGGALQIAPASEVALTLRDEAMGVSDMGGYSAFKKRMVSLSSVQLPNDLRSVLATEVHKAFGKAEGMGLRDIKSAFAPLKVKRPATDDDEARGPMPEWLAPWVYGEADCVFINTSTSDYAIKREAFRAKFDRTSEAVAMETDAANYALNMAQIPTVVRSMYWPGQDRMFEADGKEYVNSYHKSGIPHADSIDEDGARVVEMFLKHVENSIEDPREQRILLDFMAYIYQNPANRVQWGILLWGIEGNGKTYFYNILQNIMGRNARTITTSMIERPFNDWAVGARLIGIEEIRISGTNKWRILDQLKPMISNDTIAVEPKGSTSYHAPNFASYFMTTNHQDAIPMSDNDRRYCVIFTRHRSQDDLFQQHGGVKEAGVYFDRLFSESNRRVDAIGHYLKHHVLSETFEPRGRAPLTDGITEMRQANQSDDKMMLDDAIDEHRCEVISDYLLDMSHLNTLVTMAGGDIPTGRALANILREKGFKPIDKRRIKRRGAYHYVWFVPGRDRTSDWAKAAVLAWHDRDDGFKDVPF